MSSLDRRNPDEGYATAFADEDVKPRAMAMRETYSAPPPPATGGIEHVGRGIRRLVDAINSIEQLGIENSDLPLPKIVVVGDQSAGKSSLIEAISEIKVPRSSGTCTRCPLQINLRADDSPDASWACEVTLQKKYDFWGEMSGGPDGPWQIKDFPIEVYFTRVTEKDRLEEVIKLAQTATLNPQENALEYVPGARESTSDSLFVKFSPNVVRLDISGPGLPNLSFYDLPGVINQSESVDDRYLVKLVKNLVKEYVKPANVLVLLACSVESDIHNSNAARIVNNLDATSRCIGVLTKPDRLPAGSPIDDIRRILSGQDFRLGHGYYVTKQPSQLELDRGIDHKQARINEIQFLRTVEPWNTIWAEFSERFGTLNLQTALSEKLTSQISASIPHIASQVKRKIDRIDDELNALPEPPKGNAMLIVAECLNKICELIKDDINAVFPSTQFKYDGMQRAYRLSDQMLKMKPTFSRARNLGPMQQKATATAPAPTETKSTPKRTRPVSSGVKKESSCKSPIAIDDTESEVERPSTVLTSSKKRKRSEDTAKSLDKVRPRPQQSFSIQAGLPLRFRLEEVRAVIESVSVSGIPNETDIKAVEHVFKKSTAAWAGITNKYIEETVNHMKETIHMRLEEALTAWSSTTLFVLTQKIADKFLEHSSESLWRDAQGVLRREQSTIFTMNKRMMEVTKTEELKTLQKERDLARADKLLEEQQQPNDKQMSDAEWHKRIDAILKTLGPDPFQAEIALLAKVRTYYEISCLRLIDTLTLMIQTDFLEQFKTGLGQELKMGLGIYEDNAQENCVQLLADDPAREIRRTQLKKEKAALLKAQERLASLEFSTM